MHKVLLTHLLFPRLEKSTTHQIKTAHFQPVSVWLPECESQIQICMQVIREFLSGETDPIKGKKRSIHPGPPRGLQSTCRPYTAHRGLREPLNSRPQIPIPRNQLLEMCCWQRRMPTNSTRPLWHGHYSDLKHRKPPRGPGTCRAPRGYSKINGKSVKGKK